MSRILKPDQIETLTCCGTPGYVGMYIQLTVLLALLYIDTVVWENFMKISC